MNSIRSVMRLSIRLWRQALLSRVFLTGETVTLDLLYGAGLPSGADATAAIADYVAGSETLFAELMNEKAGALGLKDTHFVNASGLHDNDHYSTPHDIALIFEYAMQIPLIREVLSTYQYTTTPTEQHPEGLLLTSTLFSRVRGDEPGNTVIVAGKTGYTLEGKNCLVSMAQTPDGRSYILVTASASGKYAPVYMMRSTFIASISPGRRGVKND